jgi:transcriptional regulator GlxA family with amidase domain
MCFFTILVLDESFASSVAASLDILNSSALMAEQLGVAKPTWRLMSPYGGTVKLSNGLSVVTEKLVIRTSLRRPVDQSIWVVPGLGVTTRVAIETRIMQSDAIQLAAAIKGHVRNGGTVAASCSAVFLLAQADVLHNKKVTTTWWLASLLRQRQGLLAVNSQRILIDDGNIITAGAASAHNDLMIYLIQKQYGKQLSELVANVLLIDTRTTQAQYALAPVLANVDPLVAKINEFLEATLQNRPSLKEIARIHFLTERTLARRIVAATGLPPSALIQQLRLSKAKHLLENSTLSIEQIAEQVGYADSTALRRMIKKATDKTPSKFRSNTSPP